jgi:dihydroorotase
MGAPFDMLLRGGRVIDPASGRDGVADIAIRDSIIAAIEPAIPAADFASRAGRRVLFDSPLIPPAELPAA